MNKFKPGNKVRVIGRPWKAGTYKVRRVLMNNSGGYIYVVEVRRNILTLLKEEELELVKSRRIV